MVENQGLFAIIVARGKGSNETTAVLNTKYKNGCRETKEKRILFYIQYVMSNQDSEK
ncbi:hypothetical protein COCC4DRAFT_32211 [Bipolaris maydis ATCC 48331]|uniref:Uncharacterized protein n=2 Tax=Cochliobolus heterostrophus TaxID=5016 RepID=M2UMG0_COCH5|nr:uncharacterized protein COCC4DRAFT_32211 [Bipolaris maydis ATCC 48331]EMD89143.1 hypothetical protein COCHEDRAFT_1022637 [Bipolaris maydis C5]ENI05137.1 hypothetical protein COCC4DRAFT_32211 [Bipolaris maydis ATCC 48331]